jgi:hypothetical protein
MLSRFDGRRRSDRREFMLRRSRDELWQTIVHDPAIRGERPPLGQSCGDRQWHRFGKAKPRRASRLAVDSLLLVQDRTSVDSQRVGQLSELFEIMFAKDPSFVLHPPLVFVLLCRGRQGLQE